MFGRHAFRKPIPGSVQIEGDMIKFDLGDTYSSAELNVVHLPNALAQVQSPDMASAFVETYGPLTHGYSHQHEEAKGEPLHIVRAHADAVRLSLRLLEAMKDDDDERVGRILESAQVGKPASYGPRNFTRSFVLPEGKVQSSVSLNAPYGDDGKEPWRQLAVTVVCYAVNNNTVFMQPWLEDVEEGTRFQRVMRGFKALSLFQLVWYGVSEIALLAQDNPDRLRLCRECGTPFYALDGRQRFCPADPWSRLSSCTNRYQQRKHRQRRQRKER